MSQIEERGSTHVYRVNRISKEEIDSMVERCVYEEPPFCNAACPLKLDTRAMLKAAAGGITMATSAGLLASFLFKAKDKS